MDFQIEGRGRIVLPHPTRPGVNLWEGKWEHNDLCAGFTDCASLLFVQGDADYKVAGMYIEFANVASPEDVVAIPTAGWLGAKDYYTYLGDTPTQDYLRVPLTSGVISSTDAAKYPVGNRMSFGASTGGTTGQHGRQFSSVVNSKIYGCALVATPVWGDATQDIIIARYYSTAENQKLKPAGGQLKVERDLTLSY